MQGNDPMSYIPDVIHPDRESRMSCISIRMPAKLIAALDAEVEKTGGSISKTVRELLQFALDTKHREK
jgi:metal-responsive CopG/Arc/MetJ family transcriptional regulator